MKIDCRPLTGADFAGAHALYGVLSPGDTLPSVDEAERLFAAIIAQPGTQVIGACQGDEVLAMATLHLMPNLTYGGRPYGLIENVATDPQRRGEGLGSLVVDAVIALAWAEDAYKIMLLTNRVRGAGRFYETLGFDGDEKEGMILRRP
ncbi:MAG: GNAT family N-acetyltransferase [Sulfitobacter sp.]|nr:GNAT family N-acetyltransferase [Sulfitobacter sp.]